MNESRDKKPFSVLRSLLLKELGVSSELTLVILNTSAAPKPYLVNINFGSIHYT